MSSSEIVTPSAAPMPMIPPMSTVQAAFRAPESVPSDQDEKTEVVIDTTVKQSVPPLTSSSVTSPPQDVQSVLAPVQTPVHNTYAAALESGVATPRVSQPVVTTNSPSTSTEDYPDCEVYYEGKNEFLGKYQNRHGNMVECYNDCVVQSDGGPDEANVKGMGVIIHGKMFTTATTRFYKGQPVTLPDGSVLTLNGQFAQTTDRHPYPTWTFSDPNLTREEMAARVMVVVNAVVSGVEGFEPRMYVKKYKKKTAKKHRPGKPSTQNHRHHKGPRSGPYGPPQGQFVPNGQGIPMVQMGTPGYGDSTRQITLNIPIPRQMQKVHITSDYRSTEYVVIGFDTNIWQVSIALDTTSTSVSFLDYTVGRGWQARGFMAKHEVSFI